MTRLFGLLSPRDAAHRWIEAFFDLVFPVRCAGCGRQGLRWCAHCAGQVKPFDGPLCSACGQPHTAPPRFCADCGQESNPLIARSYARYEGEVARALLQLKYREDRRIADLFASWLSDLVHREPWGVDQIVAVPLGPHRLRRRGYNQAALIGQALSMRLAVPFEPRALQRIRETPSQVGLDPAGRRANVAGAFEASAELVTGRNILLLDDLYTTGATLKACAETLLGAGASQVFGVTVARAANSPLRAGGNDALR